mgnify:CR=1 FL=1
MNNKNKKEYFQEIYIRDKKLISIAKDRFGSKCFIKSCNNSFITKNNEEYIETHHIIPLCNGGSDSLENLALLCAHHHRVAHFADNKTRKEIEVFLKKKIIISMKNYHKVKKFHLRWNNCNFEIDKIKPSC